MARRDDDDDGGGDEDRSRGNATKAAVQSVGHSASGGHAPIVAKLAARPMALNHIVHAFNDADPDDGPAYVHQEYPKHVTVDGKLHVCLSPEHEAAVSKAKDKPHAL